MQMRMIQGLATGAFLLSLVSACQKAPAPTNDVRPATSTMAAAPAASATPGPSTALTPQAAPSASANALSGKLPIQWKVKATKTSDVKMFLVVGTEVHSVGPLSAADDSGHAVAPKVSAASATRSEIAGPIEAAPWYSATLKDGALLIERHDPAGSSSAIKSIPTTASSLQVKPFHMPKPKAPTCDKGSFLGNDNECLKECSADTDCAKDEVCEQVHDFSEGRIGPVLGSGCMKQ